MRSLLLLLVLSAAASGQINLPNEVSPYEPIVATCACEVPPQPDGVVTEIKIRWRSMSDDNENPVFVRIVPRANQTDAVHLWGHPGYHQLVATTTWVQFEIIEITDNQGNVRTIRNFLGWDTETYQHRFLIKGSKPPVPDNRPPVADAGDDQTVNVGDTVRLSGSRSTDPDGDQLNYIWALARPSGSNATLSTREGVRTTFRVDVAGTYTARLQVSDGALIDSDTVTVSTTAPTPAGPRFSVIIHETQDLTPARAKLFSDLEIYDTDLDKENRLFIFDKDAQGSWLTKYRQAISAAGQSLPAIIMVDQQTGKVVHIGPVPSSVAAYRKLIEDNQ